MSEDRVSSAGRATRRRMAVGGGLLSAAGAILAACAGAAPAERSAGAGTPARGPVPVLHWFNYAAPHRFGLAQNVVLEDFQARNPGRITLQVGESGATVALAKVKTALAAGTPPTSWFSWQVEASDLLALGALTDLSAELKSHAEWGKNKGDLIPNLLEGASWRGKLNLMPLFPDPHGLGFNRQLLTQAGASLPASGYTWNDFLELGRKAAQPPERVLFDFQYSWSYLYRWMFANGQRPLSADRTKVQFDTPQMLETVQWAHDQVTKGIARPAMADFNDGKSLTEIINTGTVTPPRYPNVDPSDGNGIFLTHYPFGPSNTRKEPGTPGNVFGFIVFKTADAAHARAAAEIAAWSVRPDVQLKVAAVTGHAPSNLVAARDASLARLLRDHPLLRTLNDLAKYNYPTPNFPSWNNAQTVINESLERLAKGELRPKDALAEMQTRIQPLVDDDYQRG